MFKILSSVAIAGLVAVSSPAFAATGAAAWSDLEEILFPKSSKDPFFTTDAVLVIKDGKTAYEKYWNGNTTTSRHTVWSISKSISSLVVGTLVKKGDVQIDDSLCKIAPRYLNKIDCGMTMGHLLEWSSGLNFLEAYESDGDPTYSSVGQMLYGDGKNDSVSFVLGHKQIYPPGTHYYYSTGDSSVMIGILKNLYGKEEYAAIPRKHLFAPLKMNNTSFEQDSSGQFLGGSSVYMSARDLSQIGQLMLNKGFVDGKNLFNDNWFNYLTAQNPQWKGSDPLDPWIPLRQWWKPDLKALGLDKDPNFPQDIIAARGHWGQYLIVVPSMKMIIIRYGLDLEGRMDVLEFTKRVLKNVRPL